MYQLCAPCNLGQGVAHTVHLLFIDTNVFEEARKFRLQQQVERQQGVHLCAKACQASSSNEEGRRVGKPVHHSTGEPMLECVLDAVHCLMFLPHHLFALFCVIGQNGVQGLRCCCCCGMRCSIIGLLTCSRSSQPGCCPFQCRTYTRSW